jgi:hypothetical protein
MRVVCSFYRFQQNSLLAPMPVHGPAVARWPASMQMQTQQLAKFQLAVARRRVGNVTNREIDTMKIEYQFGFCEPVNDPKEAAAKVREATIYGDPSSVFPDRPVQSSSQPTQWSVCFYERDWKGQKAFVATVWGTKEELNRTIQLAQ